MPVREGEQNFAQTSQIQRLLTFLIIFKQDF